MDKIMHALELLPIHPQDVSEAKAVAEYFIAVRDAPSSPNRDWFSGFEAKLDELLRRGISHLVRDGEGFTILHCCIKWHRFNVFKYLVQHHYLNVNAPDGFGETPLHFVIRWRHGEEFFDLLISRADVNFTSLCGVTPLHYACESGKPNWVDALLDFGAEVNAKAAVAGSPLHACLKAEEQYFSMEIVKKLLENGAQVDDISLGSTPLVVAIRHRHQSTTLVALLKLLVLEHGANTNPMSTNDADVILQPLDMACGIPKFSAAAVQVLLEGGANPNYRNHAGYKPIVVAAIKGNREVVEVLLPVTTQLDNWDPNIPWDVRNVMHHAAHTLAPQFEASRILAIQHFLGLGDAAVDIGDQAQACWLYYCASEMDLDYIATPTTLDIVSKLSKCYLSLRDASSAYIHLSIRISNMKEHLRGDHPGFARVYFCGAEACRSMKMFSKAKRYYQYAIAIDGQEEEYRIGFANSEQDKRDNVLLAYFQMPGALVI